MDRNQREERSDRPVALVTGAARGIGKAICVELSRKGYHIAGVDIVWLAGREDASARSLAAEIAQNGITFLRLGNDVADLSSHAAIEESVRSRFGRIDLLVNNAGIAPLQRADVLEMSTESYDRVMETNLRGAFFLTQRIAKGMLTDKTTFLDTTPCIVFITSISAATSSITRAEYCISKAGLSMAATLYADRLSASGISVFEVRPGIILSDMTAPVKDKYDALIREGLVPQGRWGTPEDVAKTVVALAGGAFEFSTGAVIEVSGGMNIRRL